MSKANRYQQFIGLWNAFKAQKPLQLLGPPMTFSDFDGPNLEESQENLRFCVDTFDVLIATDVLKELSWTAISSLQGILQNVHNQFAQLVSSRDQNSYQNFAQQLDSLAYQMRFMGLPFLAVGGAQLEKTRAQVEKELERLLVTTSDVEKLRDDVRTLVAPAVAGSLSQSFTARRDALMHGRIVWGVAALCLGGFAVYATFSFAAVVSGAIGALGTGRIENQNMVWTAAIIRSIVLLPIFASFGFAFAQYKKERDFEEEYAHKAAVATSLPNYGDLTREPAVRDQIVTGATSVIFTSPTSNYRNPETTEKTLHGMKDLLEAAAKLVARNR